jgi:hypothetical protein
MQTGAMIGPAHLVLDDGRSIQPFAVAPWADDDGAEHEALPPLLKQLRGEWACVPYGMPDPLPNLPQSWQPPLPLTRKDETFHGHSSNAAWTLRSRTDSSLDLSLNYPASHPVRRVTRRITGEAGAGRLAFELGIETRDDTTLPVALHPTFRLPAETGRASVTFDGDVRLHTYPVDAEDNVSRLQPDVGGQHLDRVACKDGSVLNLSRHPLPSATEELVLVTGHAGGATLTNEAEGYAVRLRWDAAVFLSCVMWISNKGRSAYPWSSRFQALAIEPMVAPFDLGTDIARDRNNPLSRLGLATARSFAANIPRTTRYSIEVNAVHA